MGLEKPGPDLSLLRPVARKSAWGVAVDLLPTDALLSGVQSTSPLGGDQASPRGVASRYMRVVDAAVGAFLSRDDVDTSRILLQDPEST
jgi:hypothetical protein